MDQHLFGTAIQRDHKSIVINTTPGRRVEFPGGMATIRDERDMVHLLRREDLIIEVGEWIDFLPGWLNLCGWAAPPKAMLELPPGYSITRDEAGTYILNRDDDEPLQPVRRPGRPPGKPAQSEAVPA